ncbi:MAG: radical SAM family heme chaperone HemW [Lachnospiraceae bacterium]|nr:radical SAM family heme chaperone HemW [Lachnospiraceae bacterium]
MKKLEIYIHIPFCAKKCDYCDFLSAPADGRTKRLYVESIKKEIKMSYYKLAGYVVDTVFIGGGTPSILDGYQIEDIMSTLREYANISQDAEITIECNPGTVTKEKLKSYRKAGINRISFGLQSANDSELKSIGRIHTYKEFEESFEMARQNGFTNINVDLMSALPGQTLESYKETVNKVLNLNPEHISAYSLIVEDGTPMAERVEKAQDEGYSILPDEDVEREMYYVTREILEKKGYHRYEISNYSKEGYECRHNLGYWDRVEYLGFGIGAASLFRQERYNNVSELYCYMNSLYYEDIANEAEDFFDIYSNGYVEEEYDIEDDSIEDSYNEKILASIETPHQKLTVKDEMEEYMFLGLRKIKGVSVSRFKELFGREFGDVYGKVTNDLEQKGLICVRDDYVRLTDRGIDISNRVLSEFLL